MSRTRISEEDADKLYPLLLKVNEILSKYEESEFDYNYMTYFDKLKDVAENARDGILMTCTNYHHTFS